MAKPQSINELKERMKAIAVSDADLDKFQDELDDADHDWESVKEDIRDKEQSLLFDFFRDNLDGGEKIYNYVKAIMDGTPLPNSNILNNENKTTPENKNKNENKNENDNNNKNELDIDNNNNKNETLSDSKEEKWSYQIDDNSTGGGEGTVILNAGLMIIPDRVITNPDYLESIKGITFILSYNNAMIKPARLPYQYVEFWNEYVEEEQPKYSQISEDILHNEGPTYDYLMEHPPNDRILPVLEKVVDQLKYPMLDSNKNKRSIKTYQNDIQCFFKQQISQYKLDKDSVLKKTCVLFKKNTNDTNFNTFELFINILDIYDRILYSNIYSITKSKHITDTKNNRNKNHFAEKLSSEDCNNLNQSIHIFKQGKQSFFKKLEPVLNKNDKIIDNICDYQCISLSFILFIKSFMCETGNCLEKGNHIYKPKKRQRQKKFQVNIQSLIDIKKQKKNTSNSSEEKIEIKIDDGDIFFHNDNMPLQFDLIILSKHRNNKDYNDYGLDEKYDEFVIESWNYKTPNDKQSIYKLYGDLVNVFRNTIKSNPLNSNNNNNNNNNKKEIIKKRDDRYCIVFDTKKNKFYMYPPNINNGKKNMIIHPKKKNNNISTTTNEDEKQNENKIENKFSLIPTEYNDITNFYLTNKCLIPSKNYNKNNDKFNYYGINNIQFVLSAHYHQQRQWHRHPKLRFYQYFNGCGLRLLHKHKSIRRYKFAKDIIELWPKYFINGNKTISNEFIDNCNIFDDVMDIYKCDAQFFQWDNAINRQLTIIKPIIVKPIEIKINSICSALGLYYQSKTTPYHKLFSTYCEENDINDDSLHDEIDDGVDSTLVDFDSNFPYDGNINKTQFIFNLIKQCYDNPNITFKVEMPTFNRKFFEITQMEYEETKQIYAKQCPKIYKSGMETDTAFITLLAVGRKNNFEYVQHLVDDFFCDKIKNIGTVWNVSKWINNHPHFEYLKTINYKVLNKSTPYELAFNAVNSFGSRCCPQLLFTQMNVINDSLEITIRYIESVAQFIANLFNESGIEKTMRALCPFQIDMCIAHGKPYRKDKQICYDDDDDDNNDNNMENKSDDQWVECIGDIKKKIKTNKLQYKFDNIETGGRPQQKIFTKLFNELEVKNNANNQNENSMYYLHKKRMISFVDRRESKLLDGKKDTIYVYTPPTNCVNIPRDVCGLWFISASRTSLLPDMKYGNGEKAIKEKIINLNATREELLKSNIDSGSHCKAGLLTISFHVKSKDEVKMYLYFNGQMIRFMPKDIKIILPLLFNMEYGDNNGFIKNTEEVNPIINNISRVIKDEYFNAFQRSYLSK